MCLVLLAVPRRWPTVKSESCQARAARHKARWRGRCPGHCQATMETLDSLLALARQHCRGGARAGALWAAGAPGRMRAPGAAGWWWSLRDSNHGWLLVRESVRVTPAANIMHHTYGCIVRGAAAARC